AVELAAQDQAGADARPDVQVDEVLDPFAETEPLLAERRKVHVVLERNLRPELLLDGLGETAPPPTRERVREGHVSGDRIEDPGAPDRGERHLLPLHACFRGERVRDLPDLRYQRALAPNRGRLVAAGDDLAGQVGDRGADEVPADVQPHDPPRPRVQLVQDGGGAPAAARTPRVTNQPGTQERGERLGHRRLRQVAVSRDLGPGDRAHLTDELEDRTLVDGLQQARRPRGERVIGRAAPSISRKEFGNFPNYSPGCYARPGSPVKTSEGTCPRSKTTECSRSSATGSPATWEPSSTRCGPAGSTRSKSPPTHPERWRPSRSVARRERRSGRGRSAPWKRRVRSRPPAPPSS